MRILQDLLILAAVALATWAFLILLDRAVDTHLKQQPAMPGVALYSDIEHVSHSAHAARLHKPAEVKP